MFTEFKKTNQGWKVDNGNPSFPVVSNEMQITLNNIEASAKNGEKWFDENGLPISKSERIELADQGKTTFSFNRYGNVVMESF